MTVFFSSGHLAETWKEEGTDRDGVWMILAVQMPVAPEWCESVMLLLFWSQEETVIMQSTLAAVSPVTTLPPVLCNCLQRPFLSLSLVLLASRPLSLFLRPWFGRLRALQIALDKCIEDSAPFALIVKYVSLFSYYFLLLPHIILTYLMPEKQLSSTFFCFFSFWQQSEFSFKIIKCFPRISVLNSNPEN